MPYFIIVLCFPFYFYTFSSIFSLLLCSLFPSEVCVCAFVQVVFIEIPTRAFSLSLPSLLSVIFLLFLTSSLPSPQAFHVKIKICRNKLGHWGAACGTVFQKGILFWQPFCWSKFPVRGKELWETIASPEDLLGGWWMALQLRLGELQEKEGSHC